MDSLKESIRTTSAQSDTLEYEQEYEQEYTRFAREDKEYELKKQIILLWEDPKSNCYLKPKI